MFLVRFVISLVPGLALVPATIRVSGFPGRI